MGDQAKVTSLEVLELFRSSLIIFVNKAQNSVHEVNDEIRRTHAWVQNDQLFHWQGEIRRRKRIHEQAQQELLSAKLSSLRDDIYPQLAAVRKAKAALEEAERKLRNVKQWSRNYGSRLDPLAKKLDGLRQILDYEMPRAIARLLQTQKTLESYAEKGSVTGTLTPSMNAPGEAAPHPEGSPDLPLT